MAYDILSSWKKHQRFLKYLTTTGQRHVNKLITVHISFNYSLHRRWCITKYVHMQDMLSLCHRGHKGTLVSRYFYPNIILLLFPIIIFVSSLNITEDHSLATVHCNFCQQKWFVSRIIWEVVVFFEITQFFYLSWFIFRFMVLQETLHPILVLNMFVISFRVGLLFIFTLRNR